MNTFLKACIIFLLALCLLVSIVVFMSGCARAPSDRLVAHGPLVGPDKMTGAQ